MNEIVVDTNVLIYALDKSSIFNKASTQLLSDPNSILFITTKSISEFFAVTSKIKISQTIVNCFYSEIKQNLGILLPTNNSLEIFEKLVQKYKPVGNRVYDVEIISIMLSYEIGILASFNQKDFKGIKEIQLYKF
jgi:predicted nucleic acid-binding protein